MFKDFLKRWFNLIRQFALGVYLNLRFREKLIFSYLLFGFVPLLCISIFQLSSLIRVMQRDAEASAASALRETAERLDERFALYNSVADGLVQDLRLTADLARRYDSLGEAVGLYVYLWGRVSSIKESNQLLDVTVYIQNETLVSAPPYLITVDALESLDKFDRLKTSYAAPYIGGLRLVSQRGDYWTSLALEGRPLISLNRVITRQNVLQRPAAVVSLLIHTDSLTQILNYGSEYSTPVFLADEDGVVAVSTDPALVGRRLSDLFGGETPEQPSEGRGPHGEAVYQLESSGGGGNEEHLLTRGLEYGWTLGALLDMDEVAAEVQATRYISFGIVLLGAVLSVLLFSLHSVAMERRVKRLLEKFHTDASGLPRSGEPIPGRDEIALLDQGFRKMTEDLELVMADLTKAEQEKREAQVRELQARIKPHFLYNVLSFIGWMTQSQTPGHVRSAIEALAAFYRVSLSGGRDIITLEEELKGLNAYITIQQMRGGGRVRAVETVSPLLGGLELPKLTLQPIVENAIEHGISDAHPNIAIIITSEVEGCDALIHVDDDGAGFSRESLLRVTADKGGGPFGKGYGLYNVQTRLRLCFGPEYSLALCNKPEGGARVTVRIPLAGCQ
ncbi:MAG: histidine kinase [Clostridiales bacterium]|jgi:two-component system sensor histidine kinase YesM|nr:histidine kinase [Clostridiales bacterium]